MFLNSTIIIFLLSFGFLVISCTDKENRKQNEHISIPGKKDTSEQFKIDTMANKGIGPVKSITLGPIDPELAEKGKGIFVSNCSSCHKSENNYVGPSMKGVTIRRSPEWIMNMILNPEEMVKRDPVANKLLKEYYTEMIEQDIKEDQARALLEYFRQQDSQK